MRRLAVSFLLVVFVLAGCNKAPPPTAEALASRRPPSPYDTSAPPPIVVPDSGDANANLDQLSMALRKYIAGAHRVPKDFDDFLAKSGVQPPPAPAGKKYVLQGQAIALVNQ
jgi:hypothetical protein